MKSIILNILFLGVCIQGFAADSLKTDTAANKPVFTIVKQNPITSIKNQSKSGTCWDYSTLSFFESEILRKSGKTYDLCEMFVTNKNYMDRAIMTVRLHGDMQFEQEALPTMCCMC